MTINFILLILLVLMALWTVMTTRLLRAVMGLAMTSAVLTIIMFRLYAPLAAVFELSVCAGLIPVIFITTISFTERLWPEKFLLRKKERMAKFWYLPVIVILAALVLSRVHWPLDFKLPVPDLEGDVRRVLWNQRHLDLLGQIVILLAAVFGVLVLFKESKDER